MLARRSVTRLVVVVGATVLLGGCWFGGARTGETRRETASIDLGNTAVWVNPDRIDAPVMVCLDVKGRVGEIHLVR